MPSGRRGMISVQVRVKRRSEYQIKVNERRIAVTRSTLECRGVNEGGRRQQQERVSISCQVLLWEVKNVSGLHAPTLDPTVIGIS